MLVRWKEAALVARVPEFRSQQVMGRSTISGLPSPEGPHLAGNRKGRAKSPWHDIVTGTKADSAQGHPFSGRSWAAADPGLAARLENMEKENRELRQELAKARKQNEKSTRKIEELQQTLNKILKRMGGHPTENPILWRLLIP
ncbi:hypothetical protein MRX96_009375 [Rhipicephalus microplus]